MNIHFKDKELLNTLNNFTIESFIIGSHMYGLNNEKSDLDFLNIYLEPNINRKSILWEHHQLQYKDVENNRDENYTTLQLFLRNILTGDSTINFECLFSKELKESEDLNWLYKYRYDFINYNIIKSYLGMAKRDLKYFIKDTFNLSKHNEETNKKLSHFVRGVMSANMLLNNEFKLNFNNKLNIDLNEKLNRKENTDFDLLEDIKNNKLTNEEILIVKNYYSILMDNLRLEKLNKKKEENKLFNYMNPKILKEIDNQVVEMEEYKNLSDIDYSNLLYEALEYGIKY